MRNDTRICELERQVQDLHAAISNQPSSTENWSPGESSAPLADTPSTGLGSDDEDPIVRGIVDMSKAHSLYEAFYSRIAPLYPLVLPPPPERLPSVRAAQPALFRAALTAASASAEPNIWQQLFVATEKYIVHEIMVLGKRSLQLIQAALVLAIWSHPPQKFQNINFNQMASMAATAVVDLRSSGGPAYKVPAAAATECPSNDQIELCRTYLATYLLCSR